MKTAIALLCIFLPLLAAPAYSANAWNERDVTWVAPTTCSDNTTDLTKCPVTAYKVEVAGSCTANAWNALATIGNVLTYHVTNLAVGSYCFRVKASNALGDGPASMTNAAAQTVVTPQIIPPGPPGAVTVVNAVAYEIRPNSTGVLTASRIGVIPLGTACQSDTRTVAKVTYNRVDPSAIDLTKMPAAIPPVDTFAVCAASS